MNEDRNDPLTQSHHEFRDLRLRLRGLPTRAAPSSLMRSLKRDFSVASWGDRFDALFSGSRIWKPIGAFAVVALLSGVWISNWKIEENDLLDIQPLVAAHARYQSESLVPSVDMANSGFGFQLASYYGEEN